MLEFEENYFDGEIREGFYIETMMKRAWAAQLEVLKIFENICKKYNITYFAHWGTLLGAVRHKGFIPWDDDIDIIMKRKDWIEFIKHKNELPNDYMILNYADDNEYRNFFTRIINGSEIPYSGEKLEYYHGCPYIVGLDIEILDGISDDTKEDELQKTIIDIIINTENLLKKVNDKKAGKCVDDEELENVDEKDLEDAICSIEEMCAVKFNRDADLSYQLFDLCEKVSSIYSYDDTKRLQCVLERQTKDKDFIFDKEDYLEAIEVPFENTTIFIPRNYDKILKYLYGEDYMIPKKMDASHDYPFYKNQEVELMKFLRRGEV
ncbi:LicD family protein [Lachnobacterium bovis]|uniref:LicD family protein n=1 Tax=Lachnobacterium bovis TaxID=140626 RepID=UPI00048DC093|nr:LicD family protein [Lachnobacterium bovis]